MARRWRPKYKVVCIKCGWKGRRTGATSHYPCPRCLGYPVERVARV